MDKQLRIERWIERAKLNEISWSEVAERILILEHPAGVLHHPDKDRGRRCGFGEVIFGENKTDESVIAIAEQLLNDLQPEVLVTRCAVEKLRAIMARFPHSRYDLSAKTLRISRRPVSIVNCYYSDRLRNSGNQELVCVVTAGSTDLPVAREALETLRWMGIDARLLTDVGVAGPYRLLPHLEQLRRSVAVVVCAGMEGALASVLGGLVGCPIIAVPTSVGYGANFAGVTTLLSMMSSCAAGVTVVNIDAGFKGGYIAGLIASRTASERSSSAT